MPSYGPLPLQPVEQRLRDQLSGFRLIGRAADLAAAQRASTPTTPAAYVLMAADQPRPPAGSTQRLVQAVTGTFGVVVAVRDYQASQRGAGQSDEVQDRIGEVRAALLSWRHPDGTGTSVRLGGRCGVLSYTDGVLWWQDIYSVDYHIRT